MEHCWEYLGNCLESPPDGYYGFIYKITDDQGKIYIGKKAFEHSKKVTLSKKARKASGTRKRIERTKKDSGWLSYWGSSKPFLEYKETSSNINLFRREIVKLCKDKASLSYWEMVTLVLNNVLFSNNFWNGNVSGRFFKGKIHE